MSEPARCPQCGSELLDAQPGLCPACLLKLGLSGAIPIQPLHAEEPRVAVPRRKRVWVLAGLLAAAVTAILVVFFRQSPPEQRLVRLFVPPPAKTTLGAIAVSPDGRMLAFTATDDAGKVQLWIRPLDSVAPQPLSGTDGASFPFWSPDSRHLGFFAGGKLKKVAASGGWVNAICDAPDGRGGAWSSDGAIVFAPTASGPLFRVSAAGGDAHPVTSFDRPRREASHRWPSFLPGGRLLYTVLSTHPEQGGIYVGDLQSGKQKRLSGDLTNAVYAEKHLLFEHAGMLVAQPFDAVRLEFSGDPLPVAEQTGYDRSEAYSSYSTSAGVLAYDSWGLAVEDQLTWFDRAGKSLGAVGEVGIHARPQFSPDARRLVAVSEKSQTGFFDLWQHDLVRGVASRFTFDQSSRYGVWSPDGERITFASDRPEAAGLYCKTSNGAGKEVLLLQSGSPALPTDWSPDGRFLLYQWLQPKTDWDLWLLPVSGNSKPVPLLQTPAAEKNGAFSPDGRWIAYDSGESGRSEVYVQPFQDGTPPAGGKWQFSSAGGSNPKWRRDGRELFYLAPGQTVMAVSVQSGATIQPGAPRPLFSTRGADPRTGFAVTPDGERFLIPTPGSGQGEVPPPATVVINWTTGLRH